MSLSQQTPRGIEIVPLTLHIGAEIRGVDLTKPLPPQQVKEVRDAFLKWKVVFFRNQRLDHAQHVAMARQFGEPTIGHAVLGHLDDYPEIYSVAKNRLANETRKAQMVTPWTGWHADITAAVNPPMATPSARSCGLMTGCAVSTNSVIVARPTAATNTKAV